MGAHAPAAAPESPAADRWLLPACVAVYILTAVSGLLSRVPWDDDCVGRFLNARAAWAHPDQFVSVWNRPLSILLLAGPVQLGKAAVPLVMAFVPAVACFALFRAARLLRLPHPWMVIPFFAFQAFTFPISYNALAEPLAACLLALGAYFHLARRDAAFALVGSLIPLARLELSPLLVIWTVLLFRKGAWRWIPLLAVPTALWSLAGTLLAGGDPFWLYSRTVGSDTGVNRYGATSLAHYFRLYIEVTGPVVFFFGLLGIVERLCRRKVDLFLWVQFMAGFLIYVLFSWKLSLGQPAGFLRHLVSLAPLIALLALYGFQVWIEGQVQRPLRWPVLLYSLVVALVVFFFLSNRMIYHHTVSEERDLTDFVFVLGLGGVFLAGAFAFSAHRLRVPLAALLVAGGTVGYTLVFHGPNAKDATESRAMANITRWVLERGLRDRKTLVENVWFFYAGNLDRFEGRYAGITPEALDQAPPGAVVIWDSRYARANVDRAFFRENLNYRVLQKIETAPRPLSRKYAAPGFTVVVYEKVG